MNPYEQLKRLNITLPPATTPRAAFVSAVQTGNLLFVSGQIAERDGKPWLGKLGQDVTTAEGKQAAHNIAVSLLATLHSTLGDLTRVRKIVKLLCLVNAAPDFTEPHLVANGCSELLIEVFGEAGRHARSAFGVAQLPVGACVEVELIAEVA
jgi:enamine deaminase RidA (YjgF/YER057c/UK114 family)